MSQPIIGADFLSQFSLLVDIKNCRLVDSITSLSIPGFYSSMPTPSPTCSIETSKSEFHALLGQYPNILKSQYNAVAAKHDVTHHICTNGPPVKTVILSFASIRNYPTIAEQLGDAIAHGYNVWVNGL